MNLFERFEVLEDPRGGKIQTDRHNHNEYHICSMRKYKTLESVTKENDKTDY